MFLDEARLAARIRHPNVVPTLDVVATDGELFLVMEYVTGESLARLVRTAAGMGTVIPAASSSQSSAASCTGSTRRTRPRTSAASRSASCTATSRRRTSSSASTARRACSTSASRRPPDASRPRATDSSRGSSRTCRPSSSAASTVDRRTDIFAASIVLWEALTGRRLFRATTRGPSSPRSWTGRSRRRARRSPRVRSTRRR